MNRAIFYLLAIFSSHIIGLQAMEGQLTQQKLQVFIKFFDKYQDESISDEQRAYVVTYLKKLGLEVEQKLNNKQILNNIEACAMMLWADFLMKESKEQNSASAALFYEYLADEKKTPVSPEIRFFALKRLGAIDNGYQQRFFEKCRECAQDKQEDMIIRIRALQELAKKYDEEHYTEQAAKLMLEETIRYCRHISDTFRQELVTVGNQFLECIKAADLEEVNQIVRQKIYPLVDAFFQQEHGSLYGQTLFAFEELLQSLSVPSKDLLDLQLKILSMTTCGVWRLIKGESFDCDKVDDLLLYVRALAECIQETGSKCSDVGDQARAMMAKGVWLHTALTVSQKRQKEADVVQYREQVIKTYEDVLAFVKKHKHKALKARRKDSQSCIVDVFKQVEYNANLSLGALKRDYKEEDSLNHYALTNESRFNTVQKVNDNIAPFQYGLILLERKDNKNAYNIFKKLYDKSDKKSIAHQRAALCLAMIEQIEGNDDNGLKFFDEVPRENYMHIFSDIFSTYYAPCLMMNAQARFNLGRFDEALDIYNILIVQKEKTGVPFFMDACMGAGATHLFYKNNPTKALEYFAKALEEDRTQSMSADPLVGHGIAILFADSANMQEAEEFFDKALAQEKKLGSKWHVFAKRYKAKICSARGEFEVAEKYLREVVAKFNKPEASVELGVQLILQNKQSDAKKYLKPFIKRKGYVGTLAQLAATVAELHCGHKQANWEAYLNLEEIERYENCLSDYPYFEPTLDLAQYEYWRKKGDQEKAANFLEKAASQEIDKAVFSHANVLLGYEALEKGHDIQKAAERFNLVVGTQVVTRAIYQAEIALAMVLHNESDKLNLARLSIEQHEVESLIATMIKSAMEQNCNPWARVDARRLNLFRSGGKISFEEREKELRSLAKQTIHLFGQIEAKLELADAYQYTEPDVARCYLNDIAQQPFYPKQQEIAKKWLGWLDQGKTASLYYEQQ